MNMRFLSTEAKQVVDKIRGDLLLASALSSARGGERQTGQPTTGREK
jgi:hypothetical protein